MVLGIADRVHAAYRAHGARRRAQPGGGRVRRRRAAPRRVRRLRHLPRDAARAAWAPIIVEASIRFSYAILLATSLRLLGLGAGPPTPDWGLMINEALPFPRPSAVARRDAGGGDRQRAVVGANLVGEGHPGGAGAAPRVWSRHERPPAPAPGGDVLTGPRPPGCLPDARRAGAGGQGVSFAIAPADACCRWSASRARAEAR